MGEIVYEYDNLDRSNISNAGLNLSCICSENSFSFYVQNVGQSENFYVKEIVFKKRYPSFSKPLKYLSEVLEQEQILFENFNEKHFAFKGFPFVIATRESIDSQTASTLLSQQADIGPNDEIIVNHLGSIDSNVVFSIPKVLKTEVQLYYSDAIIKHTISGFICLAKKIEDSMPLVIHLNISHQLIEVVVMLEGEIQFANQMRWLAPDDIVYYIAAILDQLNTSSDAHYRFGGIAFDQGIKEHLMEFLSIKEQNILKNQYPNSKILDHVAITSCV